MQASEMNRMMRDEYGEIMKLPGIFGSKGIVLIFDPSDIEFMFRNEGVWPARRGIATFDHYRHNHRLDIYKDTGGLLSEQGEKWSKVRTIVNPIMLKPSNVNAYVPLVDQIAIEFVDRLEKLRDSNLEVPANFGYELNKWALETICFIALDQRLNILNDDKNTDGKSKQLIDAVNHFLELSFALEIGPSLWRYISTPKYRKLMNSFDTMTDITLFYIEKSIEQFEKRSKSEHQLEREPSVLEKLLKINKNVAVIMAIDMLLAGVDTVTYNFY